MDLAYIDEIIQFSDNQAIQACHELASEQGIYAGHSSGANYFIAKNYSKNYHNIRAITSL